MAERFYREAPGSITDKLEPGCLSMQYVDVAATVSMAISLKRIADVLEGATGNDGAFCAHTRSE